MIGYNLVRILSCRGNRSHRSRRSHANIIMDHDSDYMTDSVSKAKVSSGPFYKYWTEHRSPPKLVSVPVAGPSGDENTPKLKMNNEFPSHHLGDLTLTTAGGHLLLARAIDLNVGRQIE